MITVVCYSAKHGFINCVYSTSKLKCGQEEAIFIKRIAETLASDKLVSSACKHIKMDQCKNTASQTACSILFTITLNVLLIVIRY